MGPNLHARHDFKAGHVNVGLAFSEVFAVIADSNGIDMSVSYQDSPVTFV
jgi:hypothetical protein